MAAIYRARFDASPPIWEELPPEEGLSWRETAAQIAAFAFECLFGAAIAIYECLSATCSQIKTWYRQYVCPTSLDKKLAAYNDLPSTDVPFLQKAVNILREQLNVVDRGEFNDELSKYDSEIFIKVATAAARAFVFSNQFETCSYFSHRREEQVTVEGRVSRQRTVLHASIRANLEEIRESFNKLPDSEKEKLLDLGASLDSSESGLSEAGIAVLQGIGDVANDLIQGNAAFNQAFAKIT